MGQGDGVMCVWPLNSQAQYLERYVAPNIVHASSSSFSSYPERHVAPNLRTGMGMQQFRSLDATKLGLGLELDIHIDTNSSQRC